MHFPPRIWYPIAAVLAVINIGAVWFAAAPGEPLHATAHAVLGAAFAVWATRLRQRSRDEGGRDAELDALELEADDLRRALAEAQERVDFAERMLAQRPERGPGEERP